MKRALVFLLTMLTVGCVTKGQQGYRIDPIAAPILESYGCPSDFLLEAHEKSIKQVQDNGGRYKKIYLGDNICQVFTIAGFPDGSVSPIVELGDRMLMHYKVMMLELTWDDEKETWFVTDIY